MCEKDASTEIASPAIPGPGLLNKTSDKFDDNGLKISKYLENTVIYGVAADSGPAWVMTASIRSITVGSRMRSIASAWRTR